jgi:hypothetical protein
LVFYLKNIGFAFLVELVALERTEVFGDTLADGAVAVRTEDFTVGGKAFRGDYVFCQAQDFQPTK